MAKDKKTQSKPAVSAEAAKPVETAKAVENVKPVVEEVKTAPAEKKTEKPAAEKPAAEKKAEKPVAAKKTEKPAVKKTEPAKKAESAKKAEPVKNDIFVIQGATGEHTVAKVTDLCKADFKNKYGRKQIKSIDIYVKAENGELRAYYVVNGNPEGSIVL